MIKVKVFYILEQRIGLNANKYSHNNMFWPLPFFWHISQNEKDEYCLNCNTDVYMCHDVQWQKNDKKTTYLNWHVAVVVLLYFIGVLRIPV